MLDWKDETTDLEVLQKAFVAISPEAAKHFGMASSLLLLLLLFIYVCSTGKHILIQTLPISNI